MSRNYQLYNIHISIIIQKVKHISELLNIKQDKIKVLPKKECISLIAGMVKLNKDPLRNWRIIAKKLSPLSPSDATKVFLAIRGGTIEWSKDYSGAFKQMCKRIVYPKKPKQNKLL